MLIILLAILNIIYNFLNNRIWIVNISIVKTINNILKYAFSYLYSVFKLGEESMHLLVKKYSSIISHINFYKMLGI